MRIIPLRQNLRRRDGRRRRLEIRILENPCRTRRRRSRDRPRSRSC